MSDIPSNNKLIAKNTLMLYVRMFFVMIVSLYTSRVVLQTLGVEDYGIYNVVGGVITLFSFINGAMVSSTQRYLNFSLVSDCPDRLRSIFNTSLQIHALIALGIIILGETAGIWLLNMKLNIPPERMGAAMWVYQCSIASCAVNILSAPYNADIIAHEKMSAFALISILEVSLKLGVVYLLVLSPCDKLKVYALLILAVQLLIRGIYICYCLRHFPESRLRAGVDKPLFREMSGFAGWSFVGNMASVLYTQGLNIMLNIFFGPAVNAARGVAVQVQSTVQQFVDGFQTAVNPQITKTYAAGEFERMHRLMFRSARYSFLLLFFICLPILLETDFVLKIWLGPVPENAVVFTRIMICISLIYTTANPCIKANQATGQVKVYQIVVGGILLTILPVSYIVLKAGAPAYSVFIVHFVIESIAQFFRMFMLRKLIHLPIGEYLKNIYLPAATTVAVSLVIPIIIRSQFAEGWLRFIIVSLSCLFSVGVSAFFLGFTKGEREFLLSKTAKIFRK